MRSDFNNDKDDMMLLYMLLIYGFNRMLRFNSKGDFNLPVGNVDFNKNVVNALNSYFDYVSDKDIELFNMDFQDFIEKVQPTPDDMVYLDPPYLITFSEYNKLWNEDSEMRLIDYLDTLNKRGVRFAVSNVLWHRKRYNGTFNEWAQKYNVVKIKSNYISFNDNTEKEAKEQVFTCHHECEDVNQVCRFCCVRAYADALICCEIVHYRDLQNYVCPIKVPASSCHTSRTSCIW